MKIAETAIAGAFLIDLDFYGDDRGFFYETYQRRRYAGSGLEADFVQDNLSHSRRNVLRGLHYQVNKPMGHLITVIRGCVFDVGVDLRPNSPSFGQHVAVTLSADRHQQLYLPPGIAHGFYSLDEENEIFYKCTEFYDKDDEGGLLWNDKALGIDWPVENPLVNARDAAYPELRDIATSRLPKVAD